MNRRFFHNQVKLFSEINDFTAKVLKFQLYHNT